MQKIAKRAIVIMAVALCATVTATGANGIVFSGLGISRRRLGRLGLFRFMDTSFHCTDHVLPDSCRNVGGSVMNKSMAAFESSSPSIKIGKDWKCHQQPRQVYILQQQRHRSTSTQVNDADTGEFYANSQSFPDFSSLGITSPALLRRLTSPPLGLKRPSAVQAAVFETISRGNNDVIVGAETGESFCFERGCCLVHEIHRQEKKISYSFLLATPGTKRIGQNVLILVTIGG